MGSMDYLAQAVTAGMTLELVCDRRHNGLKSTRPCVGAQKIDLRTLLSALGSDTRLVDLPQIMRCPRCGSKHFRLYWSAAPGQGRKMRPLQPGEFTLGEYRGEIVVIGCTRCRRRGEYRTSTLLAKFGPEVFMAELHERVAEAGGCRLARSDLMSTERGHRRRCQAGFEIAE